MKLYLRFNPLYSLWQIKSKGRMLLEEFEKKSDALRCIRSYFLKNAYIKYKEGECLKQS